MIKLQSEINENQGYDLYAETQENKESCPFFKLSNDFKRGDSMELNKIQKFVLCVVFWVIVSIIIFPPYQNILVVRKINCGSPFIFGTHFCPIDMSLLITRIIWTLFIGGAILLFVGYGRKK